MKSKMKTENTITVQEWWDTLERETQIEIEMSEHQRQQERLQEWFEHHQELMEGK